ncbi:MAG TPA: hypothetical protein PKW12_12690, partial [Verrucomicrobiota bacterium]|nr:hypothetical protein [Verrucomicrobiota bacterium]
MEYFDGVGVGFSFRFCIPAVWQDKPANVNFLSQPVGRQCFGFGKIFSPSATETQTPITNGPADGVSWFA